MDTVLLILILVLVGFRIISFIEKLKTSKKIHEKNRPSKATECVFCKCEKNSKDVVKNIKCRHPYGKDLSTLDNPLDCVSSCKVGIEYLDNIKIDYSLFMNKLDRVLLNETIILLSTLVPSIIALYKILGEK